MLGGSVCCDCLQLTHCLILGTSHLLCISHPRTFIQSTSGHLTAEEALSCCWLTSVSRVIDMKLCSASVAGPLASGIGSLPGVSGAGLWLWSLARAPLSVPCDNPCCRIFRWRERLRLHLDWKGRWNDSVLSLFWMLLI